MNQNKRVNKQLEIIISFVSLINVLGQFPIHSVQSVL